MAAVRGGGSATARRYTQPSAAAATARTYTDWTAGKVKESQWKAVERQGKAVEGPRKAVEVQGKVKEGQWKVKERQWEVRERRNDLSLTWSSFSRRHSAPTTSAVSGAPCVDGSTRERSGLEPGPRAKRRRKLTHC